MMAIHNKSRDVFDFNCPSEHIDQVTTPSVYMKVSKFKLAIDLKYDRQIQTPHCFQHF